ncbi:hypothetical protein ASC94_09360 [Massilia sp. Root418]|uniref:KGG domain-containing protein n=1 Tax=Massilia sp. Root418 TaxID=1736532 RepID=UPI0006F2A46C|nr:KGG domain-containing protein [Massilia sp. Root418]KQW97002.1 hypothetical protein ASC94_09360 [Massilia sp. Root418]
MASSNQGKDQDNKGSQASNQGGSKQGGSQSSKQSGDTSNRGFASMDPERQREIAAEGGRAAHEKGTAHEFTSEEARRAGSMSHKNDQNSQSSSGGSGSRGSSGGNEGSNQGGGSRGGSGGNR